MKLSTQILLAFGLVLFLSLADSYTNYMLSRKVEQNSRFLSRSETRIRNSNKTHKLIIDMQSSFRGYLLTDDTAFLDPYYRGITRVPKFLEEQKQFVKNREQRALLDSIGVVHKHWVDYSSQLIYSRQSSSESYQKFLGTRLKKRVGKNLNDRIALKFARFDKIEYATRKHHSAALLASIRNTHVISFIFISLTFIVGICSGIYIVVLITKRIRSMVRIAEGISSGEFNVVEDTRHDELTGLSTSLNIMSRNLSKTIHELKNRNAELSKFAYVVSHDLKAPVRGIHNVITWIEEDCGSELSPELRKYLMLIPERTRRMEALINGLLDYARISLKTPPEHVDVNLLVRELTGSLVPRHFTVHVDPLPSLYTERIKLEQVFGNLISNAIKYTPRADGRITVTCVERPDHYEFAVKDNGTGIDPLYHARIFEIFQTLREKNESESTGVGLAIVKKIIDEHEDSIHVQSSPGEGSTFTFTWKKQNK